jgi:hypothetical protein
MRFLIFSFLNIGSENFNQNFSNVNEIVFFILLIKYLFDFLGEVLKIVFSFLVKN